MIFLSVALILWSISKQKETIQLQKINVPQKRFIGIAHNKVIEISKNLGIDANILYGIMNFETMYTLSPQIKNGINCGGLIGFCPVYNNTFTQYIDGTFVGQNNNLLTKGILYQLDQVKKFFEENIKIYGRPKNKVEMYLMVFHPSSIRHSQKPLHIIGSEISMTWAKKVAQQNAKAFLDTNGFVTIRSITNAINKFI